MTIRFLIITLFFACNFIACADSSSNEQALANTEISQSEKPESTSDIPASNSTQSNLLFGHWIQVSAIMEGHMIEGRELQNPQRIFTADGEMVYFSDDTEPDTTSYRLEGNKLFSPLDGLEMIKNITKDSLILETQIDGIKSNYIYIRKAEAP